MRLLLRLITLTIVFGTTSSQWLVSQHEWHSLAPPVWGVDISRDGRMLLAVGDHGSVLLSRDNADTWYRPFVGTYERLNDVALLSSGMVVVVGEGGAIALSSDSGRSWRAVSTGTLKGYSFRQVSPIGSTSSALLVSDSGLVVLETISRELHTLPAPSAGLPADAVLYTLSDGVAAIEGAGLFRTTDGGETWETLLTVAISSGADVAVSPDGRFIAVSTGRGSRLLFSSDSGNTWNPDLSTAPISVWSLDVNSDGELIAAGQALDPNQIGASSVARYSFGDTAWVWEGLRHANPSTISTSTAIDDAGKALVSDELGLVALIRSENNEISRLHDPKPEGATVTERAFATDSVGLYSMLPSSAIPRTIDAGTTWRASGLQGVQAGLLDFISPDYGVALRADPATLRYVTRDQGQSFETMEVDYPDDLPISSAPVRYSSDLTPQGEGVVIVTGAESGTAPHYLLTTTDTLRSLRGNSITVQGFGSSKIDFDRPCFGAITFRSLNNGIWTFRLYRSYDHGRNVELVSETEGGHPNDWNITVGACNQLFRAVQIEDTVAWESAHMLLESTDGGETWHDVHEFDGPITFTWLTDSVWIAGSNYGRIWTTLDAGRTWGLETIRPAPYVDFPFMRYYSAFTVAHLLPDSATVLLVGEQGLLFRKRLERSLASSVQNRTELTETDSFLSLVPSVTSAHATVRFPDHRGRYLSVVDLLGREVTSMNIERGSTSVELDLSSLAAGTYGVIVLDGEKRSIAVGRLQKL